MTNKLFHRRGIQIIHGDCYEVLDKLPDRVAIVTDPPYGIKHPTRTPGLGCNRVHDYGTEWRPIIGDDKPFDASPFMRFAYLALFGANHFHKTLDGIGSFHVWDKTRYGVNFSDQSDWEMVWINRWKPPRIYHHLWKGFLKDSEKSMRRLHPTQKAVAVMHWIIEELLEVPQYMTIVDPFMGSGSTLVACATLARRCIGIEMDEEYCQSAILRVTEEGFNEDYEEVKTNEEKQVAPEIFSSLIDPAGILFIG